MCAVVDDVAIAVRGFTGAQPAGRARGAQARPYFATLNVYCVVVL